MDELKIVQVDRGLAAALARAPDQSCASEVMEIPVERYRPETERCGQFYIRLGAGRHAAP